MVTRSVWTHERTNEQTNERTDEQPGNIMPLATLSDTEGINITVEDVIYTVFHKSGLRDC